MSTTEIQLSANNQKFTVTLNGTGYAFQIIWREAFWALDIYDRSQNLLIGGLPMVTGTDLLEQYGYMGFGFELRIVSDDPAQPNPTKTNLGDTTHLYAVTE